MSLLGGFDAVCDDYEADWVAADLSGNFLAKQMRTPEYQEYERRRIERRKETKG